MAIGLLLLILFTFPDGIFGHLEKEAPLLLISFDGFRWDYLSKIETPNFERIKANGVYAKQGIKNVFVTNTLPNHWSMVTGLYPESHGVLDNHIKDRDIITSFIPKYEDKNYHNDPRYYDDGGEPIWVTNQLQKPDGRSGSIMWFGSENPVKQVLPILQMPYNDTVQNKTKIDTVIKWFTMENPINLGLVYFHEPDATAHQYGPESGEVKEKIKSADELVGYLLQKLEENNLLDDINIIITSDHGFTNISAAHLINLDAVPGLRHEDYEIISNTAPLVSFYPPNGTSDSVYEFLKKTADQPQSHFKVFKAEEIPEKFHYKQNKRVPPIVALADLTYSFTTNMNNSNFTIGGTHGYDNANQEMHPFFVAMGPSFKKGFSVKTFSIVDIYPLMCHLLHLNPAPNNGSLEIVSLLLEDAHENTVWTFGTYILVLIITASVGGVYVVAACRQHRYLKRKMLQLKLSPLQPAVKYFPPSKSGASAALLSGDDEDDDFDDDFDDAKDDEKILEIVTKK